MKTTHIVMIFAFAVVLDILWMYYLAVQKKRGRPLGQRARRWLQTNIVQFSSLLGNAFSSVAAWLRAAFAVAIPWARTASGKLIARARAAAAVQAAHIEKLWMGSQSISVRMAAAELLALLLFVLWFCRPYLNFNPNVFPSGSEFIYSSVSHFIWTLLFRCGDCVLWNGMMSGGAPAFVELQGAVLHPLVILTTLLWGVVNGSKVLLILIFFGVGLSQWILARQLRVGLMGRALAVGLAVSGGHLSGRMDTGNVVILLSIAMASFILPLIISIRRNPTTRKHVLLAVLLALTWFSGQGYIQIVVVVAYFPAILWYLWEKRPWQQHPWTRFALAGLLSVLLCAVLVIPLLHFSGHWVKVDDVEMRELQPLGYKVLNLVINSEEFFRTEMLGKNEIMYLHINYIGWIPVLFCLAGLLFLSKSSQKREILLFYAAAILVFVFTSREVYAGETVRWAFLSQLRSIGLAGSLAIQPILAIAGWGMQQVKERFLSFSLSAKNERGEFTTPHLGEALLLALVFLSVASTYSFSRIFIHTKEVVVPLVEQKMMETTSAQWVRPLTHDQFVVVLERFGKIAFPERPWYWKDRERLLGYLETLHNPEGLIYEESIMTSGELELIYRPQEEYAQVMTDSGATSACTAQSLGGHIDVNCDTTEVGTLRVLDHMYSGWRAFVDGQEVKLAAYEDWLTLPASAGKHTYQFRYRPWDVYVGILLSLLGWLICVRLWLRKPEQASG